MYISLARKYRPRTFADVAVQSHVSATMKGAIARGRVAHGYLLCGPRGVGKTTLARVLAMALNCERRVSQTNGADATGTGASATSARADDDSGLARDAGEPCGQCASCQRIWSGSASLDVVEIDAASNRGVDDARELRERAMYAPSSEGRYKVYIVDEAHMLTREAWNALLKILEEPPPRVVFVFATTEPQKIAQAAAPVLSRLQRFDFKRIGPADVRARLAAVLATEQVEAEPDALAMLARAADGSMRDALSLTDQALSLGEGKLTAARVREALGLVAEDEYLAILDLVAERRAGELFLAIGRLVDAGADLGGFLGGLADMLRAELAIALGGEAAELSERSREELARRAGRFTPGDLLRMLNAVTELEPRFRKSGQQQILIETLLVRFALMDRTVSLEEVLRELGPSRGDGGEGDDDRGVRARGAGGPSRPGPSAPAPTVRPAPAPDAGAPPVRRDAASAGDAAPPEPMGSLAPEPARRTSAVATPEPRIDPRPSARRADVPADAAPARNGRGNGAGGAGGAQERLAINRLVERWDDVIARVRADGRMVLAAALQHAIPGAVSGRGEITLELEGSDAVYQQPIADAASDVLSAVGTFFTGATRLQVRVADGAGTDAAAPRRLTEESIRSERLAMLRKRDPALDLAIDALDLELID
ncbi:MAG TPA: DNA polymerase III subunit gamma/tau [Gemmatimonadaceae bacterium]|nr:DNA polymerase III subunit gamma/tau [Gemmatimonadaceae bacterium]